MEFTSDGTMMHINGVLQSTMFHTAHLVHVWAMVNWMATIKTRGGLLAAYPADIDRPHTQSSSNHPWGNYED